MKSRVTTFRRRTALLIMVIVSVTVSCGIFFGKQWKVHSQGGMVTLPTTYMYVSYQFNTLKGPTGLTSVDSQITTTVTQYRTEFHLYIADSGNHVIRDFNSYTGTLSTLAGTIGSPGYTNGSLSSAQFN